MNTKRYSIVTLGIIATCSSTPLLTRGGFGACFGGSFLGTATGTMFGNAISQSYQPREREVVYYSQPTYSAQAPTRQQPNALEQERLYLKRKELELKEREIALQEKREQNRQRELELELIKER